MTDIQFNYMHECFERVFCELKWRTEVNTIASSYLSLCTPMDIYPQICLSKMMCKCFKSMKTNILLFSIKAITSYFLCNSYQQLLWFYR